MTISDLRNAAADSAAGSSNGTADAPPSNRPKAKRTWRS